MCRPAMRNSSSTCSAESALCPVCLVAAKAECSLSVTGHLSRQAACPNSTAHRGVSGLNAGRSLFDPAQDWLGTAHVITPGHPLIPPRDPEVGQRTDIVTASSRASRARAADDDVERPAREPVLHPAAAQE